MYLHLGHLFCHICAPSMLTNPINALESEKRGVLIVHQPEVVEYTLVFKPFFYVVYMFPHPFIHGSGDSANMLKVTWAH